MRIVTRGATYSRIAAVSTAIENSVRLITQVIHAALLRHQQRLFKADVASTTNLLRQLICIQFRRIEYLKIFVSGFNGREVFLAGAMTTLASNSGRQVIEPYLRPTDRRSRMTSEATLRRFDRHGTTQTFFQRLRD